MYMCVRVRACVCVKENLPDEKHLSYLVVVEVRYLQVHEIEFQ